MQRGPPSGAALSFKKGGMTPDPDLFTKGINYLKNKMGFSWQRPQLIC